MTEYVRHLKEVTKEVLFLRNLRDSDLWGDAYAHGKGFLTAVACFITRLLVLVIAPVSIPVLAFASMKNEEMLIQRMKEFRTEVKKLYGVKNV